MTEQVSSNSMQMASNSVPRSAPETREKAKKIRGLYGGII